MDFLKVVLGDMKNISGKKLLIIAISAISLIPIVYGGLYLAAFWDPYSKTDTIEVGVVNLDSGAVVDGKNSNYGKDIVDNLKKNNDLKWHFTGDLQRAEDDLKDEKYYALLVIPQNFSQRLSDADKGIFKKPELIFTTNKKKNYVVGLISDKASIALKDELNKSVIDSIAVRIYDSLDKMNDGMESAVDGTSKIKDGIGTMKDKIPSLKDGIGQLFDGASTLSVKIDEAADGGRDLKDGIGTLNGKMPDLADGVGKLLTGSSTLTGKISEAADGSDKLRDGVDTLNGRIPDMADGVDALYDGAGSLQDGLKQLNDNMPDLLSGVRELRDGSSDLESGMGKLKNELASAQNTVKQQIIDKRREISGNILPMVENIKLQIESIEDMIDKLPPDIPGNQYRQYIQKALGDTTDLLNQIDALLQEMQKSDDLDMNEITSGIDNSITKLQNINNDLDPIVQDEKLPQNIRQMAGAIQLQIDSTVKTLESIKETIESAEGMLVQLNDGIDQLYEGSGKLHDGLDELYDKSGDLQEGVGKLYSGSKDLKAGMGQLKDKIPELQNGVESLSEGTDDLSDGLFKIHDGSKTLTDKLGELNGNMPGMQSGIRQLYDGSTNLSDGLFKLSDGAVKIRDGLKTIKNKIPELQDGVNKIYDGVSVLHDKLADGAEQLADKLASGRNGMGGFVSDPVNMKDRALYSVNGYGEGLAPYFISLGLWVGALLMFFIITDKPNVHDEVSGGSVAIGKYMVYAFIGIIQAIFLSFAITRLGLEPSSLPMYYLFNIFLSLVFIAIMQNFVFLFGDVGRVMSILVLILQLTSSGGTFPSEMLPGFFNKVGPLLPFYYSVSALREIIWGVNYDVLLKDVEVLIVFMIVPLILTFIVKKYFDKYTMNLNMRDITEEGLDDDKADSTETGGNDIHERLDKAQ